MSAQAAAEILGVDAAAIVAAGDGAELPAEAIWPLDVGVASLPRSQGIEAALAGAACVRLPADDAALERLGGGTGLAVPVLLDHAPVAVLVARAGDAGHPIGDGACRTAEGLARLLAAERRSARAAATRLNGLVDAGMALAGELGLEDLLRRLVERAREVLDARYAALGVLNEDRTELANFVTSGLSDQERAAIGDLPRGRGILGALIREATPLRLDRIADDPRSVGFPPNHPPMSSFLGVPVALRGEAFGNLYVTEKNGGPFTLEDVEVARTLAAQAAIAVDNARRYQAERRRVAELESVQEVARAVLGTLDIDHLLPLIARRARSLTGADTVGVALRQDGQLAFRFAHGTGALVLESLRCGPEPAALGRVLQESFGAAAVEIAPLELGGEAVGALVAVADGPLDDPARRLLGTFSSQAAIALGNARAHADERERLLTSAAVQAARARERAAADSYRRAIEAQEAERARIARELHDETGQVLTAVALHLRALEEDVPSGPGRERLAELRSSVAAAAASVRTLVTELRPSGLRERGLEAAIARQGARIRESGDVEVDVALDALPGDLSEETQIALFRVVQEALTNVVRHSGASRASILATSHQGRLRLVVEDDGCGFDPAAPTARLGLVGIRERVELLGGQLRIESAVGAGTAVIVDLDVGG